MNYGVLAQSGRVSRMLLEGRWFESIKLHKSMWRNG